MGDNSDREQWAPVPGHGEYWASNLGQIAQVAPGGGFRPLVQRPNIYGLLTVRLRVDGRLKTALVGSLVLRAFGHPRPHGYRIEHDDGDPANCTPGNLRWVKKGSEPVRKLKERRCLGPNCNVMFSSNGPGNRLCPVCSTRMDRAGDGGLDSPGSDEIPDEAVFDVVGNPHR